MDTDNCHYDTNRSEGFLASGVLRYEDIKVDRGPIRIFFDNVVWIFALVPLVIVVCLCSLIVMIKKDYYPWNWNRTGKGEKSNDCRNS